MTLLGLVWLFTLWFGLALMAAGVYSLMRWWHLR